jgi:hypothetical protein
MKKVNQFMLLQWLVFLPLILPLSIASGILQGVKQAVSSLILQIWSMYRRRLFMKKTQIFLLNIFRV